MYLFMNVATLLDQAQIPDIPGVDIPGVDIPDVDIPDVEIPGGAPEGQSIIDTIVKTIEEILGGLQGSQEAVESGITPGE